jgi:tRNA(Glu) U13 pseudouridine synthase TruD
MSRQIFTTMGQQGPLCGFQGKTYKGFGAESAVIKHLASRQGQNDYQGAILSIPRNHRTIFVYAYQSLVWNTVASEGWALHGDKVVEGDLVLVEGRANEQKDEYDENGEKFEGIGKVDLPSKRARPTDNNLNLRGRRHDATRCTWMSIELEWVTIDK